MQNTHSAPDFVTAPGRGAALAFVLAGTLAVGWLIGVVYVIAGWTLGS
ncbi:MAG TPA: hypothetical protein VFY14_18905 [Streptomyces sp.]|nr:hypothetical protein [Streptomyces sp.]